MELPNKLSRGGRSRPTNVRSSIDLVPSIVPKVGPADASDLVWEQTSRVCGALCEPSRQLYEHPPYQRHPTVSESQIQTGRLRFQPVVRHNVMQVE